MLTDSRERGVAHATRGSPARHRVRGAASHARRPAASRARRLASAMPAHPSSSLTVQRCVCAPCRSLENSASPLPGAPGTTMWVWVPDGAQVPPGSQVKVPSLVRPQEMCRPLLAVDPGPSVRSGLLSYFRPRIDVYRHSVDADRATPAGMRAAVFSVAFISHGQSQMCQHMPIAALPRRRLKPMTAVAAQAGMAVARILRCFQCLHCQSQMCARCCPPT